MKEYTTRLEVPVNEKWNLEDIYSDSSKWEEDLKKIEQMGEELKKYDGEIQDGKRLYQFLKHKEELSYVFNHVYAYSMLRVDEDTRDSNSHSLLDRTKALSVKVSA